MDIAIHSNLLSQPDFAQDWQFLTHSSDFKLNNVPNTGQVEQYVNGKQLACPMPLLKLKMALRQMAIGNYVYVTATDPNSQKDIGAFCLHAGHTVLASLVQPADQGNDNKDTIFHLLITKNC